MTTDTITAATETLAKVVGAIINGGGDADGDARELAQSFTDFQRHLERSGIRKAAQTADVLAISVASIINARADAQSKCSALAESFEQAEHYLRVGKVGPDDVDAEVDRRDRERDDERDDGDTEKRIDHHASAVADLLVESGSHPTRSAALHYLLRSPHGAALLHRLRKAADQPEKESTMSTPDSLASILKNFGPVKICKHIVDEGRTGFSEVELVSALSKHVGGDRAFAELFEAEESVRRACSLAKNAEFNVFDIKPVVVSGEDARDVNDATAALRAYEEIVRIGREKFPFLPADQQFARVFEDRNYIALARQARWYAAEDAAPRGAAYTKADPAPNTDTAYAELMHKAQEYRSEHPKLSISQAFAKVYSDPANREIAKRERMESAVK